MTQMDHAQPSQENLMLKFEQKFLSGDLIEDKTAEDPSSGTGNILRNEKLDLVLSSLTERERKILEMRFGLKDGDDRTLEEIGKIYNVTRERIRQIEAKGLRKLRHPTRLRHLQGFLEREEPAATTDVSTPRNLPHSPAPHTELFNLRRPAAIGRI